MSVVDISGLRAMDRFYVPNLPDSGSIRLSGPDAHHMLRVKRLQKGQTLVLFDGSGSEWTAVLENASGTTASLRLIEKRSVSRELPCRIAMAVAPPRGDKMDLIVRKCAELGLYLLVPISTRFTVLKPGPQRIEHWRRISIEASKQCGRNLVMEVAEPVTFQAALALRPGYDLALLPDLSPEAPFIREALQASPAAASAICIIGPEGGLTEAEREEAATAGFKSVRLFPSTLTTEAAAIAALAMLAYALQ